MPRFALLSLESANRVYGAQVNGLLAGELLAMADVLHASVDDVGPIDLGGVGYLTFVADDLDAHDRFIVSNLSGTRALFESTDDGRCGHSN